jgi:hypothetical protein
LETGGHEWSAFHDHRTAPVTLSLSWNSELGIRHEVNCLSRYVWFPASGFELNQAQSTSIRLQAA